MCLDREGELPGNINWSDHFLFDDDVLEDGRLDSVRKSGHEYSMAGESTVLLFI